MTHYDKKGKVIMKSYSFDEKNLDKSRLKHRDRCFWLREMGKTMKMIQKDH